MKKFGFKIQDKRIKIKGEGLKSLSGRLYNIRFLIAILIAAVMMQGCYPTRAAIQQSCKTRKFQRIERKLMNPGKQPKLVKRIKCN
jgi:hypothetical protein